MNYTEALEFFVENGISLNEEQLENLKEASAYTRHMRNVSKKYKDIEKAREGLQDRLDNPKVNDLDDELFYKQIEMNKDNFNRNGEIYPANYYRNLKDIDKSSGYVKSLYKDAKRDFNRKVNEKNSDNTKGQKDHKRAGDYLAIQKAKKALED